MILIKTERLLIKEVNSEFASSIAEYYQSTRVENQEYEPVRSDTFYLQDFWLEKLKEYESKKFDDRGARFLLFLKSNPNVVIGYINFDNIIRGYFQACSLGYALASDYQGNGYMTESLRESIQYIFQQYNLHRIQANHLLSNLKSAAVLKKLGFIKEGIAKDYLLINGKWQDHVLTSLTNKNWISGNP